MNSKRGDEEATAQAGFVFSIHEWKYAEYEQSRKDQKTIQIPYTKRVLCSASRCNC